MSAVNLCVTGGVGFNLVCNGRLVREGIFGDVFLPPYPGDNGIAVGNCAYGLFGGWYDASSSAFSDSLISPEADHEEKDRDDLNNANNKDKDADDTTTTATTTTTKGNYKPPTPPPLWDGPLSPYLRPSPTDIEIAEAIRAASLWINVKKMSDDPESSSSKIIDIIIN